jgi:ribosomal protein L44E
MSAFYRPLCPNCKNTTMLARITRSPFGFDIRTFECPACDHVHQHVVELADPMKSSEMTGWLRGELRAPT